MAFLVDPDNGTGTDYLTINALMVAETGNMDTEVVTLRSTAGSADTVVAVLNEGAAVYEFIVHADDRHSGIYDTSKWRHEISITSGNGIEIHGFVKFEFGQFKTIASSGSPNNIRIIGNVSNHLVEIYEAIVVADNTGTATSIEGILTVDNFGTNVNKIRNSVFYDFDMSSGRGIYNQGGHVTYIHNCTAYNCAIGFRQAGAGTGQAINCCTNDCTDGFEGTFSNSSNNCSDISSDAPGTSPQTGEVAFVDEAADPRDLHLASGDTIAQGNGVDLSGDSNLAVTLDVDGDARHASTPDIGFDELAVAVAVVSEISIRQNQFYKSGGVVIMRGFV